MTVGFIGLGAMGFPMAQRVLQAGFQTVTTFHKRREAADALASLGAKVVSSPAEVARRADVIITIVPADAQLEDTVFGPNGLLSGFAAGMKKDVDLAIESAKAQGVPLQLTTAVAQIFAAASAAGNGNADFAKAAQYLADKAGASLRQPDKKQPETAAQQTESSAVAGRP